MKKLDEKNNKKQKTDAIVESIETLKDNSSLHNQVVRKGITDTKSASLEDMDEVIFSIGSYGYILPTP